MIETLSESLEHKNIKVGCAAVGLAIELVPSL